MRQNCLAQSNNPSPRQLAPQDEASVLHGGSFVSDVDSLPGPLFECLVEEEREVLQEAELSGR